MVDIDINDVDVRPHLQDALQRLGQTASSRSKAQLSSQLAACVKDKKVLCVLDNVQSAEQLDSLLPAEWGEGSVVIVTSRCNPSHFTRSRAWKQVMLCTHCLALLAA
jgi:hypothetical protein